MSLYPILEYDEDPAVFIDPFRLAPAERLPERGVGCFMQDIIDRLVSRGSLEEIHRLRSEHETQAIYELKHKGRRIAVFNPGVGGPLAAARLDAAAAMGLKKFVACGGAGALVSDLGVGDMVVLVAAVRDEGTSYHYLPPGREVDFDAAVTRCVEDVLREQQVSYRLGKTWTTDAIFRETRTRAARRRSEGCVTVEMEAASLLAVAKCRGLELGYMLYAGDSLANDHWDHRWWLQHPGREELFWLAVEAAARL